MIYKIFIYFGFLDSNQQWNSPMKLKHKQRYVWVDKFRFFYFFFIFIFLFLGIPFRFHSINKHAQVSYTNCVFWNEMKHMCCCYFVCFSCDWLYWTQHKTRPKIISLSYRCVFLLLFFYTYVNTTTIKSNQFQEFRR